MPFQSEPLPVPHRIRTLGLALFAASLSAFHAPASFALQDELEPGRSVVREMKGGETHAYRITLSAGQFCRIVVDQRGIDLVVALFRPNGEKIVQMDSPNDANGPELAFLKADTAGNYRLELRSLAADAPAGRYETRIEAARPATSDDDRRTAAQQAFTEAKSLRNQRTEASQRAAIENYKEALGVWQALGERRLEAYSLHEMGLILGDLSDYQQALDAYIQARERYREIGEPRGQASVLNNIGWLYSTLGEHRKAIDFYEQARQLARAAGENGDSPRLLSNLGTEYSKLGEYRKALDLHQQVLAIRRAGNDPGGLAITLNNIANCHEHLGNKPKALEYYRQAIALMPAVGNVFYTATTLNHIGALSLDMGEPEKAFESFQEALRLRQTIGDRNGEAETLAQIARLERDRGNLPAARARIEAAIAAAESLRARVASQPLRAAFFATVRQYHEQYLDLLMRLHQQRPDEGFDARAVQASETARARSLLELLAEARAEIRFGANPALLEQERVLRQQIGEEADRQMRMLSGRHTEEQRTTASARINALMLDHEQIEARIRQTSPRYAALTEPVPLSLKEIQAQVLDEETLLLEYALGEERSWLWAATRTTLKSVELPGRAEIEAAARRMYEALTARKQAPPNETPARRRRRIDQADAEFPAAAAALSRLLLTPVADQLGGRRLLIVGDGLLQSIPFAALPAPDRSAPLIVHHEIIHLPSASVLPLLRQETADRKPASKALAVFADPVFQANDARLRQPISARAGASEFARLRFSRDEAEEIAVLAPPEQIWKALDFAANRDLATSAELGDYRIVHFATHAVVNARQPELTGIVLSQVDEQGRPRNGFLGLNDIYNLRLSAELVVLSACETALGRDVKGEGIIGLTRGFMYAGATRVAASLWRTDDRASAELMKRFYQRLLGERMTAAAALRAAQISLLQERRWELPYFWAAFTLQGEWR